MKSRLRFFSLIAVFALAIAACSSSGDTTTTTTEPEPTTTEAAAEETSVLDLAISAGQFSTLVAAIEAAGLADDLEGAGPFTVFAPTDAAFEEAFDALGISPEELLADTETLTSILTYHVLGQEADSQLVATLDGESVETLNGAEVMISVTDSSVMVNDATVVSADLEADNGIVHVINSVLLPPDFEMMEETTTTTIEEASNTIADIVVGNEDFSTLLAAVEAAGLTDALADPDATLTVFAPTNEAFEAALEALDITAEELLADTETLTAILSYHVLGSIVTSSDIAEAGVEEIPVETLGGAELVVVVGDDGTVSFKDQTAKVIQADVEADNGVIHVIDAVLLPPAG